MQKSPAQSQKLGGNQPKDVFHKNLFSLFVADKAAGFFRILYIEGIKKIIGQMKIKRVYEKPKEEDGRRILVDRIWPRGLTKEKANVDLWLKNIAPSEELRKWFGHEPDRWQEFRERYKQELAENNEQVAVLKEELKKGEVTLVYGAKDEQHNQALVIKEFLLDS